LWRKRYDYLIWWIIKKNEGDLDGYNARQSATCVKRSKEIQNDSDNDSVLTRMQLLMKI